MFRNLFYSLSNFSMIVIAAWLLGFSVFALLSFTGSKTEEITEPADGIIVLTGAKHRIAVALDLLSQGKAQRLLISGTHTDTTMTDIFTLYDTPAELASKVDLDDVALDTIGNAKESMKWVEKNNIRTVILVTSAYHMPRAVNELMISAKNSALKRPLKIIEFDVPLNTIQLQDGNTWVLMAKEYNKTILSYIRRIFSSEGEPVT